MSQKFRILVFFTFFSSLLNSFAQTPGTGNDLHVNAPYSRIGIGELAPIGNLRNIGMGGTGVSFGHPEYINSVNPALLIHNRVQRYDSLITILEASGMGQLRNLKNSSTSNWTGNINFNSFAYAFPITKRWTSSIGIHPFSTTSYSTFRRELVNGSQVNGNPPDTSLITNSGHGGIYQADFANGIKLHKSLNLGFQVSYLFGALHSDATSQLLRDEDSIRVGSNEKTSYSGFLFRPGLAFRKKIQPGVHADSAVFLNVGITYDFFGNIKARETLSLQRRTPANIIVDQTTVSIRNARPVFPASYRAGVSFDKFNKWNVGADFTYSKWADYVGADANDTLHNSFTLAVGAEFLVSNFSKDPNKKGVMDLKKNYLRAGFSYTKTPILLNGNRINDVSLSLGYTFSVGDVKRTYGLPLPKLNVALVVGQMGTKDDGLIRDLYFKAYFGMTINDKWFRKRRID